MIGEKEINLLKLGFGGVLGLIGAAYLSQYVASGLIQLIAGFALLFVGVKVISGTDGWKGMVRLAAAVAGTLFVLRGALTFVPSIKAQADALTMNIL